MIVPSIDLMDGQTVQLVQGKTKVLDAGDPRPIAEKFARVGEIAVVDLDAALSRGSNAALIEPLLRVAPCRVGGGIRDAETALRWLDRGATKVVLGTAAKPEILHKLPRARVVAALDARDGNVVVEGWTKATGASIADRLRELIPFVGGFLVTFVEREGTMTGTNLELARELQRAIDEAGDRGRKYGPTRLTIAGGVRIAAEIGELDRAGMDAQIGMALYTGAFDLGDAVSECLTSDRPDGLWPTIVADEHGVALGLAYSNKQSLKASLDEGRGVYWSRRRGLWRKGEESGAVQTLLRVDADCDRDCLRFTVRQGGSGIDVRAGAFCHVGTRTCFGSTDPASDAEETIATLARRLARPPSNRDSASYTSRLLADPGLLHAKLREEADELTRAATLEETAHEAADVIYFTLVKLAASGVTLEDVERVLRLRSRKVSRRAGDAKPA
ncbi:MAG: phosphoribosyl-ATP diphosphatase [Planctomycetota bacterium]|nr:phosphoribosyl-ATP diphosphatase [Planctomycetota bacterium]